MLVDRLWPRGLTKEAAALDEWLKDVAPSNELRKWFHSHPPQWSRFREKYLKELAAETANQALQQLYEIAKRHRRLTLLYASKDERAQQRCRAQAVARRRPQAAHRNRSAFARHRQGASGHRDPGSRGNLRPRLTPVSLLLRAALNGSGLMSGSWHARTVLQGLSLMCCSGTMPLEVKRRD